MALWDKLKTELDRAGRVAQSAFDEGKARLEIVRVRQLADRAAQALGYAVYNARKNGAELDTETYQRLSTTLAAHEAEAQRLEAQLEAAKAERGETMGGTAGATADATGSTGGSGSAGGSQPHHVDPAMGDSGSSGSSGGTHGAHGSSGQHGSPGGPYSGPSGSGSTGY